MSNEGKPIGRFWSDSESSSRSDNYDSAKSFSYLSSNNNNDDNNTRIDDDDFIYRTPDRKTDRTLLSQNPDLAWDRLSDTQRFIPVTSEVGRLYDPTTVTRFVLMSDTHGTHRDLGPPPRGDVLIHCGDFTRSGEASTIRDLSAFFSDYYSSAKPEAVVVIAGNHELTYDGPHYEKVWPRFHVKKMDSAAARQSLTNCVYLEDDTYTTKCGMRVYGSPWQPVFHDWAFNLSRGDPCREKWEAIPSETDILITHGPPLGRGDLCCNGSRAGCVDLLDEVQNRIRPRLHVFGHIHEDAGIWSDGTTVYVNASNVAVNYQTGDNPYVVLDIPKDGVTPIIQVLPCPQKHQNVAEWVRQQASQDFSMRAMVPYFEKAVKSNVIDGEIMLNTPIDDLYRRLNLNSGQAFRILRRLRNLYRTNCY